MKFLSFYHSRFNLQGGAEAEVLEASKDIITEGANAAAEEVIHFFAVVSSFLVVSLCFILFYCILILVPKYFLSSPTTNPLTQRTCAAPVIKMKEMNACSKILTART